MREPVLLFENENFIAVDKPMGWLSVPSRLGKSDARPCVGTYLEKKKKTQIFPVHRLDEPVSGILLFATNAKAHAAANSWFESSTVSKHYQAYTLSECVPNSAMAASEPLVNVAMGEVLRWESLLCKGKKRVFEAAHGKAALTMATCVGSVSRQGKALYEWKLEPKTGRNHQLRYELAKRGYAILGDTLYGSKESFGNDEGVALRAVTLDFSAAHGAWDWRLPEKLNVAGLESLND